MFHCIISYAFTFLSVLGKNDQHWKNLHPCSGASYPKLPCLKKDGLPWQKHVQANHRQEYGDLQAESDLKNGYTAFQSKSCGPWGIFRKSLSRCVFPRPPLLDPEPRHHSSGPSADLQPQRHQRREPTQHWEIPPTPDSLTGLQNLPQIHKESTWLGPQQGQASWKSPEAWTWKCEEITTPTQHIYEMLTGVNQWMMVVKCYASTVLATLPYIWHGNFTGDGNALILKTFDSVLQHFLCSIV